MAWVWVNNTPVESAAPLGPQGESGPPPQTPPPPTGQGGGQLPAPPQGYQWGYKYSEREGGLVPELVQIPRQSSGGAGRAVPPSMQVIVPGSLGEAQGGYYDARTAEAYARANMIPEQFALTVDKFKAAEEQRAIDNAYRTAVFEEQKATISRTGPIPASVTWQG